MPTLSIVIPAYNEEGAIGEILRRTLAVCDALRARVPETWEAEVIVVNDGSTDGTPRVVECFPRARLIAHARNQGYGAALKTGFSASTGDYILFLDADGTYPPELLPRLLEAAERTDADMVVGSRLLGERSGMPPLRRMGNRAFAGLLRWLSGRDVTDTASGMRLFRKGILPVLHPLPDGLHLTPAMSTHALLEGLRVVEVPIPYDERQGRSKLRLVKDGVRFLRSILGIAWTYNPLKLFGLAGFTVLAWGFLLGLGPLAHYLTYREVPDDQIYRLFAVLLLAVTGLNCMIFGVSANYVISLVRGRSVDRSRLGQWLHPRLLKRFGLVGVFCLLSAVLLNLEAITEYATTFRITAHWSYILTGVFLFLVGTQLIMGSSLVVLFEALNSQQLFRSPHVSEPDPAGESPGKPRSRPPEE